MSKPLIILVGLIYAYIAAEQVWMGNNAMGVVYGSYSMANVGLWMLAD